MEEEGDDHEEDEESGLDTESASDHVLGHIEIALSFCLDEHSAAY